MKPGYDTAYRDAEPNRFAGRRRELLALIREAFNGVELGNGVGLRETLAIDDYGTDAERLAVRATDEQHDWSKVIDDPDLQLLEHVGGSAFVDAESLRLHLPAYLSRTAMESDGGTVRVPGPFRRTEAASGEARPWNRDTPRAKTSAAQRHDPDALFWELWND